MNPTVYSSERTYFFRLHRYGTKVYCHFLRDHLLPLFCRFVDEGVISRGNYEPKNFTLFTSRRSSYFGMYGSIIDPKRVKVRRFRIPQKAKVLNDSRIVFTKDPKTYQPYLEHFNDHILNRLNLRVREKRICVIVERVGETRRIENFNEFVAAIRTLCLSLDLEVRVIRAEELTFSDQVTVCREASMVIAMHGSFLANGVFFREDATVVEILPAGFSYTAFRDISRAKNFFQYNCSELECPIAGRDSNFKIDTDFFVEWLGDNHIF
ncbi:MAG: glycosyltransferase family 61 protein [Verrucomicrobiota bacterium]